AKPVGQRPSESNRGQPAVAKPPVQPPPRKNWLLTAGSVAVGILLAFTAVTAAIHFIRPADVGRPISPRPGAKITKPAAHTAPNSSANSSTTEVAPQIAVAASDSAQTSTAESPVGPGVSSISAAPVSSPTPQSDPLGLVRD